MSTREIYHNQGVKTANHWALDVVGGCTIYRCIFREKSIFCPVCGSQDVGTRGYVHRRIQALPVGKRPTYIDLDIPRIFCPVTIQVVVSEAGPPPSNRLSKSSLVDRGDQFFLLNFVEKLIFPLTKAIWSCKIRINSEAYRFVTVLMPGLYFQFLRASKYNVQIET
jgi:hypothetical protein